MHFIGFQTTYYHPDYLITSINMQTLSKINIYIDNPNSEIATLSQLTPGTEKQRKSTNDFPMFGIFIAQIHLEFIYQSNSSHIW